MKKINLFNRNTNSPSYRGTGPRKNVPSFRGNAESPRCCRELVCGKTDGIPLFSGMTKKICHKFPSREGWRVAPAGVWFAALVALFVATPSFAEPTELDKKTVASKAYVDTKQDKITTGLVDFHDDGEYMLPAITTYDTTSGLVGNKIGILDMETIADDEGGLVMYSHGAGEYGAEMDNFVPTVRAVAEALQDIWETISWSALRWSVYINGTPDDGVNRINAINAYNTTFGSGTNQWAGNSGDLINGQFLANSLALKQNKITTGLVTFREPEEQIDYSAPALVSYGTGTNNVDGVLGNKIGILGMNESGGGLNSWDFLDLLDDSESAYLDNFVPTVRAVAYRLGEFYRIKQDKLPAAWTSTTDPRTMASTGGQTIELATTKGLVGQRYITAGGSQPLTKKSGADNVILYVNGTKTVVHYQISNFGGTGSAAITNQNRIKEALVSLELLKDVYSELNSKITNNALPTGTTGTVVTYNGTNQQTGVQQFTETAISGTATYDDNDQLTNGNNIANVSLVETEIATRQKKRTCAGYEPGHENEADYCWLWNFPD